MTKACTWDIVTVKADLLAARARYNTVLAVTCKSWPRCVPFTILNPCAGADPARPLAISCNAQARVTTNRLDHQLRSYPCLI